MIIALLRGKIDVSDRNLLPDHEKLWTRKFVTTCDVAVPTTVHGKGCSNGNHRRRQTQGYGSLQEKL